MPQIEQIIAAIEIPESSVGEEAQARLDHLTKPRGSLGRLEETARRLCVMRGSARLPQPKAAAAVFAADHGVALAGISVYPREVTAQMVLNFLAQGAGINVLANLAGAQVKVVDVGVDYDFPPTEGLVFAKVAKGTKNLLEESAMTQEEALRAIQVGADVAAELIAQGCGILIPGEMGIGNTTPSAALAAGLTGAPVEEVTGRGTGLDDAGWRRKVEVIKKALALHQPGPQDPLGALASVGGLEIAAICGYALMAASRRVPVVMDGLISTAGCLVAAKLAPAAKEYFIAGHVSQEAGQKVMLRELGLRPLLDLDLRLGEGTGAALALQVIRGAVAIYNEMATFESAGVSGEEVG